VITVHLEGSLAKKLGESKLELKVRSVKECLSAMGANFKDFEELLLECSSKYLILIDGVISNSMTALYKKVNKSIHFIPMLEGAFVIIPAVTAIKLALGVSWLTATLVYVAIQALIVYGTMALMAHLADGPGKGTSTSSNLFPGTDNVVSQGGVVPIGYGRRRVGSRVVSTSLSAIDKNIFESDIFKGISSIESFKIEDSKIGAFSTT
jgi:predicted phage tail protein